MPPEDAVELRVIKHDCNSRAAKFKTL